MASRNCSSSLVNGPAALLVEDLYDTDQAIVLIEIGVARMDLVRNPEDLSKAGLKRMSL